MCVEHALSDNGCEEKDVEAREVTYGDCETPWIICRCANANLSMDDLMLKFGFVPPGIRSYVGGMLAVFDPSASAGTSGDFIVFRSNCSTPVFIHESAHSLDQGTNGSDEWRDAIAKSDCVPDDYANTNEAEDFAQVTVVHSYLAKHGSLPSDPACLKPQLDVLNNTPRLALAQSTKKCLPDKRPFVLKASTRTVLGKDGWTPTVPAAGESAVTRSTGTSAPTPTNTPGGTGGDNTPGVGGDTPGAGNTPGAGVDTPGAGNTPDEEDTPDNGVFKVRLGLGETVAIALLVAVGLL